MFLEATFGNGSLNRVITAGNTIFIPRTFFKYSDESIRTITLHLFAYAFLKHQIDVEHVFPIPSISAW